MSGSQAAIVKPFQRLGVKELARLEAVTDAPDLLVKGHHTKDVPGYRGGCLPWMGLSIAATIAGLGPLVVPDGPWAATATGLALACGVFIVRDFLFVRIAGRLLRKPEGWVALAWSPRLLVFRSFGDNLLVPWSEVAELKLLGPEAGAALQGTLWIHLVGGKRILVAPRPGGGFAGRSLKDWHKDLEKARRKAASA